MSRRGDPGAEVGPRGRHSGWPPAAPELKRGATRVVMITGDTARAFPRLSVLLGLGSLTPVCAAFSGVQPTPMRGCVGTALDAVLTGIAIARSVGLLEGGAAQKTVLVDAANTTLQCPGASSTWMS